MRFLATGMDSHVLEWSQEKFGLAPKYCDMALGVIEDGELVGSAFFHAWNGPDIELSYYGPNTLTLGIYRSLMRIAVNSFGVSRVTIRTARNNKTMTRGIKKLGFEFEGIRHHGYGKYDAIMYGLYGEKLARLAGKAVH